MSFSHFLTVLRARWVSGALVFLLVLALTVVGNFLWPKEYTATGSVLIDLKSPDPIAGAMAGLVAPGYMATQIDLIQSERVGRRAIASLGLNNNAKLRQDWMDDTKGVGDFNAWLVTALAKKMEIKPSRDSNVLTISYASRDPNFSAAVVNAFVKGYVETTLQLRTEPARQFNTFFDERANRLRDDLAAAQAKLSQVQKAKGITSRDERLDIEQLRLAELSSQVVALETSAAEASSRATQAAATPDRMQEALNNPVVASIQADLSRQEARLEELTQRLGEANPQVVEARGSIKVLRDKLQAAVSRASGSVTVTNTVAAQRLAQLRAARDEQRAKVLRLKGGQDEVAVLQRDVENAQRAYDAVVARSTQSNLESQITQTNVTVVKEATPPPEPSSPKLLLNVGLALFMGALLGMGTSLLRERADPRMRREEDVTQVLKQPLLMVMPRPADIKKRLDDSARHAEQRLSGSRFPALGSR